MKNYFYIFTILVANSVYAQFDFIKKATDKINEKSAQISEISKGDIVNNLKNKWRDKLLSAKKEYDESNFNYAISLNDNAAMFESKDRNERSRNMILAAMGQTDATIKDYDLAIQKSDAGEIFYANGKYKLAEKYYKESEALFLKSFATDSLSYIQLVSNLGLLYHTTGKYIAAEEYTQKALNFRKNDVSKNAKAALAASINNLGVLYKDLGKYSEAEKLLLESVEKNREAKTENSIPYCIAINNLAVFYQTMGRYNDAQPLLENALRIAEPLLGEKSENYIRMMTNLALLFHDMGKYKEAEELLKKGIKIKERRLGTGHPDYAHMLNNLASLYMDMKINTEVEALLKKAAGIYKTKFGEKNPAYAASQFNLASFYRINNNANAAEPLYNTVLAIQLEILGENHPDYIKTVYATALNLWQQKKYELANTNFKIVFDKTLSNISKFFPAMSETEKTQFWSGNKLYFETYNSFAIDALQTVPTVAETMYNNQLATKALLLNATNKTKTTIAQSKDKNLIKLYNNWVDQKEYLSQLYSYSKENLKEENINLDSVENVVNKLEKEISLKTSAFGATKIIDKISYKDVINNLGVSEAAIEFIQFRKFDKVFTDSIYYGILIAAKDLALPKAICLKNGLQLEQKNFKYYRNCIKQKIEDENSYSSYWETINEITKKYNRLYLSLDGIYNQISINSLYKGNNKYLIDDSFITFVTNTKDIINLKKQKASTTPKQAVVVGNPSYGGAGEIADLPGTKIEAESINKMLMANAYTTKLLLKAQAKEEFVKAIKNPKLLHIATHGFFQKEVEPNASKVFGIEPQKAKQNPLLRSGLLFADAEKNMSNEQKNNAELKNTENGILSAYEVTTMQLDKTELVVLSACETGLGDIKAGEGVYGLQRAFLVAGANTIIMSLWTVSDEATQVLMTAFYKNWLQTGNKQNAFRLAQTQLKSKYKEPYYWGAFVMVD